MQLPALSPPLGIDPKRYSLCLLGPLALGLSLGIQVTMTALMVLGPSDDQGYAAQLTEYGKQIARPEHDLSIFIVGALLTMAAVLVAVWYWRAKLACLQAANVAQTMTSSALLQGVLAITSLLSFLLLVSSCWFSWDFRSVHSAAKPLLAPSDGVSLLLPGVLALLCAILDLEYGWLHSTTSGSHFELWRRRISKVLLYAVPLFIILVVGVPPGRWSYLAGRFFMTDGCHHLNFFMMGPALSFAHGRAFGTEIYSQYGIGWPLLASMLSRFSLLTYGNLVGIEIVYGCVYYLAVSFLLRNCFKQELWAAFGVVLAIYWQMFSGMKSHELVWLFPSSTPLRHPMDVWFFLALVMHQRSGRIFWAVLAGFAAALGVFFETETGVYLLVTFLVYSVLLAGLAAGQRRALGAKGWLLPPLAFCSTAAVTLLPLLLYASRGTLFTRAFWSGWVEALIAYAGEGVGALPLAELPDTPFVFFVIMVTLYLGVITYAFVRAWHQNVGPGTVLLATLAAYGLALLLLFVNRSHPFNLCHAAIPFAVILTALIFQGYKALEQAVPHSSLPYALVGGLILLLLAKAEFQRYPSFLASIFTNTSSGGVSLRSNPADISGLPQDYDGFAREFQDICSAIRTLAPDGKSVAILDLKDTLLYSAANASPWSRYASLFHMALTQQSLDGLRDDLIARAPKYVVTQGEKAPRRPEWDFVWNPLYEAVTNRYELVQTVGPYEIWALPNSGLAHCRAAEALLAKGRVAEAVARYTEAVRLEPDLPAALNNLAWIRAAHSQAQFRDGPEAVRLAERACRVTGYQQPILVGTLAAAYAEAGRFDEAIAAAEKARALALATGQNEVVEKNQQLAELFRARRPYHEPGVTPARN